MLLSRRLRHQTRRLRRTNFRPLLALVLVSLALDAFLAARRQPPAPPYRPYHLERVRARNESYFIVSVHRNTGAVLPAWNTAVLDLVEFLGRQNVFVSAVESGSQDDTKKHLCDLMEELDARRVPMEVRLGQTVWEQLAELYARPKERRPGWIWNRHDRQYDLRRIPYLSDVRNLAMAPLGRLAREGDVATGMPPRIFDKIVWINDVVFDTVDMAALLDTRGGDYAAACSVDFKTFPRYYDTFALRDVAGRKAASAYWPWFRPGPSRAAVLAGEPAPVFACWNGIVVFDAAPFYTAHELAAGTSATATATATTRQGDGGQGQGQGLRFRGVPDSLADLHLEGSECCLVHADNALSAERGVWLNPDVRVGYGERTYREIRRAGGRFGWPAVVAGAWAQRWEGWVGAVREWSEARTVRKRLASWMAAAPDEERRYEPGAPCLINEMQIMWENGWRHL